MDIINKLHTCFRDCEYFEFGEGYVKFYDKDQKKYYKVTIEEELKTPEKTILSAQGSTIVKKMTKDTRKTWESILKAKNKKL
jgi:hypothetical protein